MTGVRQASSKDDKKVIFDYNIGSQYVGIVDVDNTKINQVIGTAYIFLENRKSGVWLGHSMHKAQLLKKNYLMKLQQKLLYIPILL